VSISKSISRPIACPISIGISSEYGGGAALPAYNPAFWLNNLGLSNQAAASTRTSTATAWDHEGVLVTGEAGEIMLDGGRREQNFLSNSGDFTHTDWRFEAGKEGVATYNVEDALGGNAGLRLEADVGRTIFEHTPVQGGFTQGNTLSHAVWIRRVAGAGYIKYRRPDNSPTTLTVTSAWELFQTTSGPLIANDNSYWSIDIEFGVTIDICFPIGSDVTGRSNTAPPDYIDSETDYGYGVNGVKWYSTTNGNTESGGVVTEAPGVAIDPVPQVLMQPQRTNSVINNCFSELGGGGADVFSGWSETEVGGSLVTQEVNDVPAGSLTALRFDVSASIGLVSVGQISRLYVGVGGISVLSAMIKSGNTSGLKFEIKSDDGSGGSVEYLNSTGTAWQAGYAEFIPSDLPPVWGKRGYTIPATNAGRTHVSLQRVARGYLASLTHLITALQLEPGLVATTPIQTTTAPVTRDNDLIEADNWDGIADHTEGLLIYKIKLGADLADTAGTYIRAGSASNELVDGYAATSGLESYDGTNTSQVTSGGLAGEEITVGVIWSATYNKFVIGYYDPTTAAFVWGSEKAFSSWTSGAALKLEIGYDTDEPFTQRSLLMYKGMPPATTAFSDSKTWVEAEAANEILKYEG